MGGSSEEMPRLNNYFFRNWHDFLKGGSGEKCNLFLWGIFLVLLFL
jgi:hypothetical protein